MQTVMDRSRPERGKDGDVDLLIEKGFLLLGSIEFQIEEHLMSHGTRIDPETRFFMAQVRDAAGDAAARLLDEARSRLDAAPVATFRRDAEQVHSAPAPATAPKLPQRREVVRARSRRRARRGLGSVAIHVGLGTAAAALCAALLLSLGAPEATPKVGTDKLVVAEAPPIDRSPQTRARTGPRIGTPVEKVAPGTVRARPVHPEFRTGAAFATGPVIWLERVLPVQYPLPGLAGPGSSSSWPPIRRFRANLEDALVRPQNDGLLPSDASTGASVAAGGGEHPPYPDPRAGPQDNLAGAPQATAEAALELSRATRIEVQRRLALAEFDPHLFDGIFGPATRSALGAWQGAAGLAPTGYLDGPALALLRHQTNPDYRAWKDKQARAAQRAARTVLASPLPPNSPTRREGCHRGKTGSIVYGLGVRCDFRGLREDIARLLG